VVDGLFVIGWDDIVGTVEEPIGMDAEAVGKILAELVAANPKLSDKAIDTGPGIVELTWGVRCKVLSKVLI
jgi:hypothetical protein